MSVEVAKNVWDLDPESGASCYLVLGAEAGLVIDTGIGRVDVAAEAASLAGERPLMLVNTHYHMDHTGGNAGFKAAYANPADFEKLRPVSPILFPATEGQEFVLEGRTLRVMECPGHTPGGICLVDDLHRMIFTGDVVSKMPIWMQNDDCDLGAYIYTLERLLMLKDDIDLVFGCHGPMPLDLGLCAELKALAEGVISGGIKGELHNLSEYNPSLYLPVRLCRLGQVSMLLPV